MLAIAGGKGGVGKTTTTLGLAAALARQRRRPLAVDADADMPDLGIVAGVRPAAGLAALAGGRPVEEAASRADRWPGVDVVTATPGGPVRRAVETLDRVERPVLLDCPAGAGSAVSVPLRAAERVLVVTTTDPQSVEDARKTVELARALGAVVLGIVVTRSNDDPERVQGVAAPVLEAIPPATGSDPLADLEVRASYARLAGGLREAERLSWTDS